MLMFSSLFCLFPDGKHLPILSITGLLAAAHCASKETIQIRSRTPCLSALIGLQHRGTTRLGPRGRNNGPD